MRKALAYVAMGLHSARQHMLIKGVTLIDGDRVTVKIADVDVDTGRVDVGALFEAGADVNQYAFLPDSPIAAGAVQGLTDEQIVDAIRLVPQYSRKEALERGRAVLALAATATALPASNEVKP